MMLILLYIGMFSHIEQPYPISRNGWSFMTPFKHHVEYTSPHSCFNSVGKVNFPSEKLEEIKIKKAKDISILIVYIAGYKYSILKTSYSFCKYWKSANSSRNKRGSANLQSKHVFFAWPPILQYIGMRVSLVWENWEYQLFEYGG